MALRIELHVEAHLPREVLHGMIIREDRGGNAIKPFIPAHLHQGLTALARSTGVRLLYSASVGGGAPLIEAVRP